MHIVDNNMISKCQYLPEGPVHRKILAIQEGLERPGHPAALTDQVDPRLLSHREIRVVLVYLSIHDDPGNKDVHLFYSSKFMVYHSVQQCL